MRFVCKNCNYRFESEKDVKDNPCPYCGRREVIKELDAQELLNEDIINKKE